MSKATYYVTIRTLYTKAVGTQYEPDPNQVYGVLVANAKTLAWPTDLTTVKIPGLTSSNSVSPIVKTVSGSESFTFGQYYSAGVPIPWPTDVSGTITVPATIPSSSSASTSQTASSGSVASETGSNNTDDSTSSMGTGATPTSTSSSSSSHVSSSHSSGLSSGATAGIAIGCVLAGLVIGIVAAFCLLGRRAKHSQSNDRKANHRQLGDRVVIHELDDTVIHELHDTAETYASEKGTPAHIQLNQFLLEATPDRDIAQEVQSIGALIDQHVETYYHNRPVNTDRRTLASALAHIGFPSSTNSAQIDAQSAAVLCLDPRTRQAGLRHVIMRTLFSSIDTHSPNPFMLPAPVATFLQAIPPAESDRYADAQANSLALRKWRNLSAFLLHPTRSQRTSLPIGDAAVAVQAQELASSLNSFLRFFAEGQQQQQQVGHLQAVIAECAKLGYMLFSHPSDWGFVYEVGATHGVVVEAGLDKLGDRDGAPYPSPRTLVEPVVVSYQSGH